MEKKNTFELNGLNLAVLQNKNKIYTYLNSKLDKAYFKLSEGKFVFALNSSDGLITTTLDIDYHGDVQYFSVDYNKWQITLQKFNGANKLKFLLNKSFIKIYVDDSLDEINLGIISYDSDSVPAKTIDEFIPSKKSDLMKLNHKLELTPEILSDFDLMNSLFSTQNRINSIGLSKSDIMYADRSVVVKANLSEHLSDDLFTNIDPDDNHIYLHSFVLKLFEFLHEFNTTVYFDEEYDTVYWGDSNSELIVYSDSKNVSLPTEEQFKDIQPVNKDVNVEVSVDKLKDALNFFTGFYEGSSWKPLKFSLKKDTDTILYYKHPTAEINKTLNGVISNFDGEFVVESETLRKILIKIRERFNESDINVKFTFDPIDVEDEAPGVYCTVGSTYEFIISKLLDE